VVGTLLITLDDTNDMVRVEPEVMKVLQLDATRWCVCVGGCVCVCVCVCVSARAGASQ
jgi:hypothetical protein